MSNNRNSRVFYFDYLKGIAIIMVVFAHIDIYILKTQSAITSIISTIHLPLFMFISGFLSYKEYSIKYNFKVDILGKSKRLLLPFISMSLLFAFLFDINYVDLFNTNLKNGFWFTYSLFFIYVIYRLIDLCFLKKLNIWFDLIVFSIIFMIFLGMFKYRLIHGFTANILSFNQLIYYFPAFVFGAILRKYENAFKLLITNNLIFTLALLLFSVSMFLLLNYNVKGLMIIIISGLTSIVIFMKIGQSINEKSVVNQHISVLGQQSLEIYLLHFFVLRQFSTSDLLGFKNNSLLYFISSIIITIIIIYFTKLLILIISKSKFLDLILFGKK